MVWGRPLFGAALSALLLSFGEHASAATVTWTGASNTSWFTAGNWSPAQVPTSADDAIIDANSTVTVAGVTPASFNSLTLGDSIGTSSPTLNVSGNISSAGLLTINSRATLLQSTTNQLVLGQVVVASGGTLKHAANTTTRAAVLNLNVAGDFNLQAGATITVDGMGYAGGTNVKGNGPGGGSFGANGGSGGGGGHGGPGGNAATTGGLGGVAYDDPLNPTNLGSGASGSNGAPGGSGGGAVLLNIGGNADLEGLITGSGYDGVSNGSYYGSGGGAGGSVNIIAGSLSGNGSIRANGGIAGNGGYNGISGGGGGGRIAIAVSSSDVSHLTLLANGGAAGGAAQSGGAGTIAMQEPGTALFDLTIGSRAVVQPQAATPITGLSPAYDQVTLGNVSVVFDTGSVLTLNSLVTAGYSTITANNIAFGANSPLFVGSGTVLSLAANSVSFGTNSPVELKAGSMFRLAAQSVSGGVLNVRSGGTFQQANVAALSFLSVLVESGARLTHAANVASVISALNMNVANDFILKAGATVAVDGMGYAGGTNVKGNGPGGGGFSTNAGSGGGGGHGGNGGSAASASGYGGSANDDPLNPTTLGSGASGSYGAPGGNGGGVVLLNIGGNADLEGLISANGYDGVSNGSYYGSGGGSGGSVNISAANLLGSGSIRANGGLAGNGGYNGISGGGGGGRIAIAVSSSDVSHLTLLANGGAAGGAAQSGGAGTIATKEPGATLFDLTIGSSPVVQPQAITPIGGNSGVYNQVTFGSGFIVASTGSALNFNSLFVVGLATFNIDSLTFGSPGSLQISSGSQLNFAANSVAGGNVDVAGGAIFRQINTIALSFSSFTVEPGGILTHLANNTARTSVINLNLMNDFILKAGAIVLVDGMGYAGAVDSVGYGPAGGSFSINRGNGGGGGGGGHGGMGGYAATGGLGGGSADDLVNPIDLGSGGSGAYPGENGGGAVIIHANGTVDVDGIISANGNTGYGDGVYNASGGGAGGSVNIVAANLTGSGSIHANGGAAGNAGYDGISGGGGGGRISISATASDASRLTILANGGTAGTPSPANPNVPQSGGAGTFVMQGPAASLYDLTIGSGVVSQPQALTPIGGVLTAYNHVTVANCAPEFSLSSVTISSLVINSSVAITANDLSLGTAFSAANGNVVQLTAGHFTVPSGSSIEVQRGSVLALGLTSISGPVLNVRSGGVFELTNSQPLTFASVLVESGAVLTGAATNRFFNLTTVSDFNLQSGGSVLMNSAGYAGGSQAGQAGSGPSAGVASGGGGGHGGQGGNGSPGAGGGTDDSVFTPASPGSGGGAGSAAGGAGGGVIILNVGGIFTSNGTIAANGAAGTSGGGGGAGGSVDLSAGNLAGVGSIQANGGAGDSQGGGGGGGRIALFYGSKAASWNLAANGGSGYHAGAIGTILDNGQVINAIQLSSGSPTSLTQLQQKLSTGQTISETIAAQVLDFSGVTSTGTNLNFSLAQIQLVTVQTGSFAGDGFFNGSWVVSFSSVDSLSGSWQGTAFLTQSPRSIVLNGAILGGIRGVLEGVLTESVPGSGVFNQLSANLSAIQIGPQVGAAGIYLTTVGSARQSVQYPGTALSLVQTSLTGPISGNNAGNLETTFTLVRVNSTATPFYGQGFFLSSYSSSQGTGIGWAYATSPGPQAVTLAGILEQPLRGLFEGALVLSSPQSAAFTLGRLDVGLPVQPLISLALTQPNVATPLQLDSFVITVRNDGYAAANGMTLVAIFPDWADFVTASGHYLLYNVANWWSNTSIFDPLPFVRWDIPQVPPRSTLTYSYQSRVRLYNPSGPAPHSQLSGGSVQLVTTNWANQVFAGFPGGGTP